MAREVRLSEFDRVLAFLGPFGCNAVLRDLCRTTHVMARSDVGTSADRRLYVRVDSSRVPSLRINAFSGSATRKELLSRDLSGCELEPKLGRLLAEPCLHTPERLLLASLETGAAENANS